MSPLTTLLRWFKRKLEDLLFPLRLHLGRKIMFDSRRQIVQVSPTELIKGPCSEQELEAMLYVSSRTAVHLPRVHRIYRRRRGMYIAMDFVRGERLDKVWPGLSKDERKGVVGEICGRLKELHAITVPSTLGLAIASCDGGAVHDGILSTSSLGPFATLSDFRDLLQTSPNLTAYREMWDSPQAEKAGCVLTHVDIAPRNIIRRDSDGALVIIDWEFSGWWPEYWERIKYHFADFPETPEWTALMDEAMGT